jgi:hypothetical protein
MGSILASHESAERAEKHLSAALRYQKYAIQTHPAIFQTVSEVVFCEVQSNVAVTAIVSNMAVNMAVPSP